MLSTHPPVYQITGPTYPHHNHVKYAAVKISSRAFCVHQEKVEFDYRCIKLSLSHVYYYNVLYISFSFLFQYKRINLMGELF